MVTATNEHYVPRFYLRGFTYDSERLYFFDKSTLTQNPANVRNVASERGFYDFPEDDEQPLDAPLASSDQDPDCPTIASNSKLTDDALTAFDRSASEALQQFLQHVKHAQPLDSTHKRAMALYVAIQYLRTPETRRALVEATVKAQTAFVETHLGISLAEHNLRLKYKEASVSLLHADSLLNLKLRDALRRVW